MDADTIMNVGTFCNELLQNPTFQFLSGTFEQGAIDELLATKPHEQKTRESIYARVSAHREFITMLAHFVKQKAEAEQAQAPKDHLDTIDDPNVHDIYKGIID